MTGIRGPRRTATRQRLYDAAAALVAEQGFSGTTVEEIAERAGVAKGTVYYNFGGKTELFEELLAHGWGLLGAALREAADRSWQRGDSPGEILDALVRGGLAFCAEHPSLVRVCVAELWRPGRPWHATVTTARGRSALEIERVLRARTEGDGTGGRRAADPGDGPLGVREPAHPAPEAGAGPAEPGAAATGVLGVLLVTALDWQSFQPHRSLEEVHAALSPLLPCGHTESGRP
ncbi:TetR/AcrR family transcriptional regulator [Streptomyces sp. SM14]|uniref:TetR/AcrR family transcriptional regulator n=2 Tax=unclassified Streptomyces TaxID=2593676 RepID=UPI000CD542AB|nr:TetR/AcrR family transcriptional regulator [Streptomyces sp. SM14]